METKSNQVRSSARHLNEYEKSRLLRIQENQKKLQAIGVKQMAKSLTSLVESEKTKKRRNKPMDTGEKDVDYMPNSDFDVGEQHYEEDATRVKVSKKKHCNYIAPMSMNKHANLAKQRVIAPNDSRVLESHMEKGQPVNTSMTITSRVQECAEGDKRKGQQLHRNPEKENKLRERVTKGELILNKQGPQMRKDKARHNLEKANSIMTRRSSVANGNLSAIVNDDDHEQSDMRSDDMNEEQNGAENDDIEDMEHMILESHENDYIGDIHVNEGYEEQDSSENEDMDVIENDLENDNDLENENDLGHDNDEFVQQDHEVPQTDENAVGNVRKRVRGPTRMPKLWVQEKGKRIPIVVNENGQPISDKSSQLTHFMGTLSRSGKYCPLHKPWNKVADKRKRSLIEFLKTKFDIPKMAEDWILRSIGQKVKNWRARVKEYYHDPSLSLQEQISSRPKQVQKKQWLKLVKYWNKKKTKSVSEKNKDSRAKKKMMQVTGKKSYARVREDLKISLGQEPSRMEMFRECFSKDGNTKNVEAANAIKQMEELSSQLPTGTIDKPGPNDVFSKVMGKDQNGNGGIDMFGLGVRASDVWGVIPSRSACRRENIQLKSKCEELTHIVAQYEAEKKGSQNGSIVSTFTSDHLTVVSNEPCLRVGHEVFLKSILNSKEIVAKGRVKSLDQNEQVGGKEIGKGWCEVDVQVAIKRDEDLVRPYGFFVTIADVIGASVAWPCNFISVVREE